MSLVNELLKIDKEKVNEQKTGTFKSERLAELLGKEEPVEVKIQGLPVRRIQELYSYYDEGKEFDASLLVVCEGLAEPELKGEEMRSHFGAATPKDLIEKLFGMEVPDIAVAIVNLSKTSKLKDSEDKVKN